MSCGVSCRLGWDLALLWLQPGPVATAPIGSLAWELLHAMGVAGRRKKGRKKERKKILEPKFEFETSTLQGEVREDLTELLMRKNPRLC